MGEIKVIKIPKVNPIPKSEERPVGKVITLGVPNTPEKTIGNFLKIGTSKDYNKLLQEVIVRFNTDPRRYEKSDFATLILSIVKGDTELKESIDAVDSDWKKSVIALNSRVTLGLNSKVDKEPGKSLITEEERLKLSTIEDKVRLVITEDRYLYLLTNHMTEPDVIYYTYETEDEEEELTTWSFGLKFPLVFGELSSWLFGSMFPISFKS